MYRSAMSNRLAIKLVSETQPTYGKILAQKSRWGSGVLTAGSPRHVGHNRQRTQALDSKHAPP